MTFVTLTKMVFSKLQSVEDYLTFTEGHASDRETKILDRYLIANEKDKTVSVSVELSVSDKAANDYMSSEFVTVFDEDWKVFSINAWQ